LALAPTKVTHSMAIEISSDVSARDRAVIERLLEGLGTREPTLERMWLCIDSVWDDLGCNNEKIDNGRLGEFYGHPIWLLNGLFAEQHPQSVQNRIDIAGWIAAKKLRRMADFGGGFGTLARMTAEKCPEMEIDVIEPYPSAVAVDKCRLYPNISYKATFSGQYDLIVAMDVFEHVPDPLRLVHETAHNLKIGGIYLTANCFYPVIKCHLPRTFHFRRSWNLTMRMLKLRHIGSVSYGSAFEKTGTGNLAGARVVEVGSRFSFATQQALLAARRRLKIRARVKNVFARSSY
jgi:SAM-dependent methyltransferase